MNKNTCLGYIFDKNTEIVILGTFPSDKSRDEQKYYRNSRNQFWAIIQQILGNSIKDEQSLLRKKIGLWDVFSECEGGNNNKEEKKTSYNDFMILKEKSPNLKKIIFNGKKAYREFKRYLKKIDDLELKKWLEGIIDDDGLPSSSSAYTLDMNIKIKKWKEIISKYI